MTLRRIAALDALAGLASFLLLALGRHIQKECS